MNMKKMTFLFAILLMLTACNGTRVSEKLDLIDSLIAKEQFDSASIIHHSLNEATMTEEDKAHYYLLATQLGYVTNHPLPSDSLLDMALTYYNKVGNNQKLADAYYYKSAKSRINQDYPQAILYCKEAEHLADQSKDIRLRYKIAENLAYLNGLCGDDRLQLHYSKKALAIARSVQNKNWMVYTYNKISIAFTNLEQYDSAFYYIEKSIPYFEYVYNSDKVKYLANIGILILSGANGITKFPLFKMFGTRYGKRVEDEIKFTGRKIQGTFTDKNKLGPEKSQYDEKLNKYIERYINESLKNKYD